MIARRPRRAAVIATLVVAALLVAVLTNLRTGMGDPGGTASELAGRLDRTPAPRFRFTHRGGGTGVLDCFLPNRELTGSVDLRAGVAVLTGPDGAVLARRRDRRVLLHRSLFTQGAVPTEWLAVDLPTSEEHRAALTRALGADLAGYVLSAGLPSGGTATAEAALDAAADVERLGSTDLGGRTTTGYRITLNRDDFDAAASAATSPALDQDADVDPPLIDIWIDSRGRVARVAVQPTRRDGSAAEPEGGWTVDYQIPGPPLREIKPTGITLIGDVKVGSLRSSTAAGACEVPL